MSARREDGLSKTLAGTLLGFALAMAVSGLFAWLGPGGPAASNKFQFVMWLVSPVWVAVLSFSYLFASGRQAWFCLGAACVLAYAGLFAARLFLA